MQVASKRIGAIFAAACVIVALAFGGVYAWAKEHVEGQRSITVTPIESVADDIGNANVELAVYKIADAVGDDKYVTYNYDMVAPFDSQNLKDYLEGGKWEDLANGAVSVIASASPAITPTASGALNEPIQMGDGEAGNGVFLVLPHGSSLKPDQLKAYSDMYEYTFKPITVALPTKDGTDPDGNLNSAYGEWTPKATVSLKVETSPLYGSLKIKKNLTKYAGKRASFEFKITGEKPDGSAYNNNATITVDSADGGEVVIEHIPAGTKNLTVTEVNSGGYQQTSAQEPEEKVIVSDMKVEAGEAKVVTFEFVNKPVEPHDGYIVENKFVFDEEKGDWDWQPYPKDAQMDARS